jgi:hypothetical protein
MILPLMLRCACRMQSSTRSHAAACVRSTACPSRPAATAVSRRCGETCDDVILLARAQCDVAASTEQEEVVPYSQGEHLVM